MAKVGTQELFRFEAEKFDRIETKYKLYMVFVGPCIIVIDEE